MELGGLHEDTAIWSASGDPLGADSLPGPVAGFADAAAELAVLCERIEALVPSLAALARDGSPSEAAHGAAARDAMAAAGRLAGASAVVSSLAFTRMDQVAAHLDDGVRDAASWASLHAGLSLAEVSVARRVNRVLGRFPQIAEAFLTGTLRNWHLVAVDSIIPAWVRGGAELTEWIDDISAIQGDLLQAAALCETERRFRRFCAAVRERLDVDGPRPVATAASSIELRQLANGRWSLLGDLSADDGAIMATLIDEQMRRDHDANKAAGKSALDEEATLTYNCRRANAAMRLVRDGASASKPGRVGLFVHLDLSDLILRGGEPPLAHTEAGYDISDDTLWAMLADADVIPVITDEGTPLSYGRTRRLAPEILRHILAHRDKTCSFPGCDASVVWAELHHLDDWAKGGSTDPLNLRATCRFHHHLHHDGKWLLDPPDPDRPGAPGAYRVTRPDGTRLDPEPRWRRRARRNDPLRIATRARVDELIGQRTAA